MPFDPALAWLARGGLALLFAVAAAHKLRDPRAFQTALRNYRVLPASALTAAALLVGAGEALAAALLLLAPSSRIGPALAIVMLCSYSFAIGLNLARGRRHIDCGCLGPGRRQTIGAWMLVRNLGLAAPALLLLLGTAGGRPLSWIDGVSIAGGLAVLALSWDAAHRLAASPTARRPFTARVPERSA